jgi:hypothetical protein
MYQTFSFNRIHITLIRTNNEVLMNAARYQARLIKSRALLTSDTTIIDSMLRFCLIMAHVIDTDGFPFAVPDPFAHPETVGLAWDAYTTEDPTLWDELFSAIDIPTVIDEEIEDKIRKATEEMDAVSAHTISPFKRKRNTTHGK